jgi:hypothetical protein
MEKARTTHRNYKMVGTEIKLELDELCPRRRKGAFGSS